MKWPQRGEPLSLIGGCGRGRVRDLGKDWQPSPLPVLFQSPLKYLKQRCELFIQPVKSPFPPKVTARILTHFGGYQSGWDVKPLESTLPTKGNEKGLSLVSWDWPNSKHQSQWIKVHTPLTRTPINPVCSPPTSPLLWMPFKLKHFLPQLKGNLITLLWLNGRKCHSIQHVYPQNRRIITFKYYYNPTLLFMIK